MAQPIHVAARDGDIETLKRLIEVEKVPVDTLNRLGSTPLFTAVVNSQPDAIRWLVSAGADINILNGRDRTPLMGATHEGLEEMVDLLLSLGADPKKLNVEGLTVADIAYKGDKGSLISKFSALGVEVNPEKHLELAKWLDVPAPRIPQIFVLGGGHGCEDIEFDSREVLPDRYKLIVISKCSDVVYFGKEIARLMKMLSDMGTRSQNKRMRERFFSIEDTFEEFKAAVGLEMSLYLPGDRYPTLMYDPLGQFEDKPISHRSGVFAHPLPKDHMAGADSAFHEFPLTGAADEFDAIYDHSIFPTARGAKAVLSLVDSNIQRYRRLMTTHLKDIMAHLGPGVYFFVACRFPTCEFRTSRNIIERYKKNSTVRPIAFNVVGHYDEALALLDLKNASRAAEERNLLNRIRLTRRKSFNQQAARGAFAAKSNKSRKARRTRRARRA
jgi:hypothetical protein